MSETGIVLRGGSASAQFLAALHGAQAAFPDALGSITLPQDTARFRSAYPELLPRFEALRQAAPQRTRIAQHLYDAGQASCTHSGQPLHEALGAAAAPLPVSARPAGASLPVQLAVTRSGEALQGGRLRDWVHSLHATHKLTDDVLGAFSWLSDTFADAPITLEGRKVVIFGAGAVLAPTELLLRTGADVLWIDRADPGPVRGHGRLHVAQGADLLASPARIRETVLAFSGGDPVDLCLYAYAPGQGREWRLTAAMNAIVDTLPAALVRTVSMFVSPAIPTRLTPRELTAARERRAGQPLWQAAMSRLGLLGRGDGHVEVNGVAISRAVISMQGVSYQASQYLGKVLAAEAWNTRAASPLHVSANTAAISATPSMDKPMFRIAFRGAVSFGIDIFAPETTRGLNGLLMLRDWLDPAAAGNPSRPAATSRARAEGLSRLRVHGGAHGMPHPAEQTLRMSGVVGLAQSALPWR